MISHAELSGMTEAAIMHFAANPDLMAELMAASGLQAQDLRAAAYRTEFAAAILDFLCESDERLLHFARSAGFRPERIAYARAALEATAFQSRDVIEAVVADVFRRDEEHRYLDAVLAEPKRWRAILLPAGYPPAFRKRLVQGQRRIVGVFEKAGRATMPPDTDVELLARALLALLLDAGRIVLDEADTYPPQRVAAFTASMATRIIARPAR